MLKTMRFMRLPAALFAIAMLLACAMAWRSAARADTAGKKDAAPRQGAIVKVELPSRDASFPPGVGVDIANSQCLVCHSAAMILTQPPLKREEWRAEITKMRTVYGARILQDQVDALAEYLKNINGRE